MMMIMMRRRRRTGACRRKPRDRLCCNSLKSEEIIAQRWVICLSGAALLGDKSGGHKILDALAMEGGLLYNGTKFLSEKDKLSGDLDWNGEIPRKKLVGTFFGVNNFSGHCWSCCEELSFVAPQEGRSSRHHQGATWQMSLELFGKACLGDDHPRAFCSS